MPCVHLKELYELCEKNELRIASPDTIRIVCRQCEEQEVCPTLLTDGDQVLELPQEANRDQEANRSTVESQQEGK